MKLPNKLIITADWHLRATKPRCRKDENWIQTQRNALNQILNIAINKNCSVFCVGDIFHSNNDTSFQVIQMVQDFAKKLKFKNLSLYLLCGNHDLQYHSSENIDKSAIGILLGSENIYSISIFEDVSAPNFDEPVEDNIYVFRHILTFPDFKSIPPNCDAVTAKELLEENKFSNFIFTGDYHQNFHYELNGRHVVNSGCLLRQVADLENYQCGVYFVDTTENICEFIPIIDSEELIDDSYIIQENEREQRIENFVLKLKDTENVSLDFLANVESSLLNNELDFDLKKVIKELLEV